MKVFIIAVALGCSPCLANDLSVTSFGDWAVPNASFAPQVTTPPSSPKIPTHGSAQYHGNLTGQGTVWQAGPTTLNGTSTIAINFGKNSVDGHFVASAVPTNINQSTQWFVPEGKTYLDLSASGTLNRATASYMFNTFSGHFGVTKTTMSDLPGCRGEFCGGSTITGSGVLAGTRAQTTSGQLAGEAHIVHPNTFTATFTAKK